MKSTDYWDITFIQRLAYPVAFDFKDPCIGMLSIRNYPDLRSSERNRAITTIRIDSHCQQGYSVPPYYDNLIGKLIVHGVDRDDAISRMRGALAEFRIDGIETNILFQAFVVGHQDFKNNKINTRWLENVLLPDYKRSMGE